MTQTYTTGALRDPLNASILSNVGSNGLDAVLDIQGVFATATSPWTSDPSGQKFPVTGLTGASGPTIDGTHPTDYLARGPMTPPVTARAISWLQANVTAAPTNVTVPLIIGPRYQGATLNVIGGSWSLGASAYNTLSYQWKQNGTVIVGATASTYTVQAGDVGKTLTCSVTATNAIGSATVTTSATGTIIAASPVPPSFPASGAVVSSASIVSGASFANVGQAGGQTDPLGGTAANKVSYSSAANNQKVVNYGLAAVVDGSIYTASIYAKAADYQFFYLQTGGALAQFVYIFDATNGLVLSGNITAGGFTGTQSLILPLQVGIIPIQNGFFRAWITFQALGSQTSGTSLWFGPMSTNSGIPNSPGAGTTGFGLNFWNVQLAAGAIDS